MMLDRALQVQAVGQILDAFDYLVAVQKVDPENLLLDELLRSIIEKALVGALPDRHKLPRPEFLETSDIEEVTALANAHKQKSIIDVMTQSEFHLVRGIIAGTCSVTPLSSPKDLPIHPGFPIDRRYKRAYPFGCEQYIRRLLGIVNPESEEFSLRRPEDELQHRASDSSAPSTTRATRTTKH